jgi:predicted acylesterase/phospholipase RssA
MKGGITSGVVYPLAVCELARRYRLESVGGASAGAIAAVGAAAAEHGRHTASGGFTILAGLPTQIAAVLSDLFQPQRSTAAVFRLLLAVAGKPEGRKEQARKPFAIAGRFLLAFLGAGRWTVVGLVPLAAVAAIALGFGGGVFGDWAAGLVQLAAILAALVALVPTLPARVRLALVGIAIAGTLLVAVAWDPRHAWALALWALACLAVLLLGAVAAIVLAAGRAIAANSYGLVTGTTPAAARKDAVVPPLGDWLHAVVNQAAGRTAADPPLTFGDLHAGAPGDPHPIQLVVMTTCLSQSRSYRIPNDFAVSDDLQERWFFDRGELRAVLPEPIVDHLVARAQALDTGGDAELSWLCTALEPLLPLPSPEDWPLVLAARMSLSFPVLLSAVPLRKVDWTLDANADALKAMRSGSPGAAPKAERCWFSDGGITSNFPVHFFDSPLPRRPTFGINLRHFHPNHEPAPGQDVPESEKVYLPATNRGGIDEWWSRFDEGKSGVGAVLSFLGAIKTTALNWGDNEQMKVPGYRDRVAHISHSTSEGGMNLEMPTQTVSDLSERGRIAGERLRLAFTTPADENRRTDWLNHKWVRLRTSTALLDEALGQLRRAYSEPDPTGVASYHDMLRLHADDQPSYRATIKQRDLLRELFEGGPGPAGGLLAAADHAAQAVAQDRNVTAARGAPSPLPDLRVMPGHRPRSTT